MTYDKRQRKKSQFTTDNAVTNDSLFDFVKSGVNKKTSWSELLDLIASVFGLSMRVFDTQSELVASDIRIGEHAIVVGNRYALYSIGSLAAGNGDVTLDSGFVATQIAKLNPYKIESYDDWDDIDTSILMDNEPIEIVGTETNKGIAGPSIAYYEVGHTKVTNDGTIWKLDSNWYAERVYDGAVDARWFGAVGDNVTDDGAALQSWIEYGDNNNIPLYLSRPPVKYYTTTQLLINNTSISDTGFIMKGDSSEFTVIRSTFAGAAIKFTSADPVSRGYFREVHFSGFAVEGDGINTTKCMEVYGAAYGNSIFRDLRLRGAKQTMLEVEQSWGSEIINCQIGYGSESRTTSGTIGIDVINGNAINIRDTNVSSLGLNYDGTGVRVTSAESVNINDSTIENMQTYVEIQSGQGAIQINGNYFENSTTVQGLVDLTESPIKLGTVSQVNNVDVSNNWFLVGNNAINVDFENVVKGKFSYNTHNSVLANVGYYKCGANSRDIEIAGNKRIFSPVSGVSGMTATTVTDTENATRISENESLFFAADVFSIDTTETHTPTTARLNDALTYVFAASEDAEVSTLVMPPISWGRCKLKATVLFSADTGGTNTIVYFGIPVAIQADGTLITPGTVSNIYSFDSGYTADVPIPETYASNWIIERTTAREPVKLRFKRTGVSASDTFTGNINFYGMILERIPLES